MTGAAGAVGSLVVRRLANESGVDVTALVRDRARCHIGPRVRPALVDYADPASLDRAMHGADALIFIGSDGEADRMLSHHHNMLGAARRAGVGRVVLLSSQDADENSPFCYAHTYAVTERWLRKSHPSSVVVRSGLYAEFFGRWALDAAGMGVLSLPMPTQAVAPVAKADVAAALVSALRAPPAASTVCHVVTGPHAYDHDQLADLATQLVGRPVASRPVSTADFAHGMLAAGVSPWWRYAFETMFAAIERGAFAATTDSVRHLTGRAPIPFPRVLHGLPPQP